MSFSATYYRTFAMVAILPYIGGTFAHTLRLLYNFPILETPFWIHWFIVLFAGYASLGFILFAHKIEFRGMLDKLLYGLVIFHLGGSVIMHAFSLASKSNSWMGVFPMGYSYFAIFYFMGLGIYCIILNRRISGQ